jgi:hypothetical protein
VVDLKWLGLRRKQIENLELPSTARRQMSTTELRKLELMEKTAYVKVVQWLLFVFFFVGTVLKHDSQKCPLLLEEIRSMREFQSSVELQALHQ